MHKQKQAIMQGKSKYKSKIQSWREKAIERCEKIDALTKLDFGQNGN